MEKYLFYIRKKDKDIVLKYDFTLQNVISYLSDEIIYPLLKKDNKILIMDDTDTVGKSIINTRIMSSLISINHCIFDDQIIIGELNNISSEFHTYDNAKKYADEICKNSKAFKSSNFLLPVINQFYIDKYLFHYDNISEVIDKIEAGKDISDEDIRKFNISNNTDKYYEWGILNI